MEASLSLSENTLKSSLKLAGGTAIGLSLLILCVNGFDVVQGNLIQFLSALAFALLGSGLVIWGEYKNTVKGIKNNGVWFKSLSNRGIWAWILGIFLTGFYVLLYWYPTILGLGSEKNTGVIALFDPLNYWISGNKASQWFMYGTLYTFLILTMGVKFIIKYRHNPYQIRRTLSVMFFQLIFAFLLPEIMIGLNMPYNDFKNIWPLNYYFFDQWHIQELLSSGAFGMFALVWGIILILVITPIFTYYFGKRWYCSWVCGCGGLAETAGDPFRQLSDKSTKAWHIERWIIYPILGFAVIMTFGVLYTYFTGQGRFLFLDTYKLREWYGFFIGAAFSGVIGVGFYPIMGSRVWCRFGCPMAAILGIGQKFKSRFRITTNGGQCISCGNCSTYCEMGIDVRSYAQKGENIIRASCVGCGICAAVCPRGVLNLENAEIETRKDIYNNPNINRL